MSPIETFKPPALLPGNRVGIILPASAPLEAKLLDKGLAALRSRGFDPVMDDVDSPPHGYLAATDDERAKSLNRFLNRTDLAALIAVRGGYGAMRILERLDFEAARRHPKLLVGFSDITALHFALYVRCGWTAIQGPMAAVEWPDIDESTESHFRALAGGARMDFLAGPGDERLTSVRTGTADGHLLGGNLAAIVRLVGTPFLPEFDDAILFLEDVGEPPYRIDALLAQLKLAGILNRLGGVVLGGFTACDPKPDRPSLSVREVLMDYFSAADYPVADGLIFGHFARRVSMPFGVRARLTVTPDNAVLSMLEPVTAPSDVEP